jgi:phosphoglycolate phosphatase
MSMVIFDFDGTIADSFTYVLRFLEEEAAKSKPMSKQEQSAYRGMSMKDMALQLGIPLWRLPSLYFKGRRVMRGHILHVKPFNGVPEAIKALHDDGQVLCIVSANSAKNVRQFLRHYKLDSYFSSVRGGAGLLGKVTPIKQLLRRYKVAPDECWYVGDEVQDVASAKAAGVKSLAVSWGFANVEKLAQYEPTALVELPQEIVTRTTSH